MNNIINWLSGIGIEVKFLLNGLIGALILSIYKKTPFWESIRQIVIGSVSAGIFTPFIIERLHLSDSSSYVTAFIVGLSGMSIMDIIIKQSIAFFKKFNIFLSNNQPPKDPEE